jgi:hypothetical protein
VLSTLHRRNRFRAVSVSDEIVSTLTQTAMKFVPLSLSIW